MAAASLTVTDNGTGRSVEVAVEHGSVRTAELVGPLAENGGRGLVTYDPGLTNTATCRSAITNIDGEAGRLQYRGYPIEDLCARSSFLEVAYLLIRGELPTEAQFAQWADEINTRNLVHESVKHFLGGFHYDAHPMVMLAAAVGALSSFYADADEVLDDPARQRQVVRLLAKMPTLTAFCYRHMGGRPFVYPEDDFSYPGNLLSMMFRMSELKYEPNPALERAVDVILMVHADHEQNASTTAVRAVGSTHVNPYSAVAAGIAALSGPMRGGAARDALAMLRQIGKPGNVPGFLERVKDGDERLMGFGHWVYKAHDPRAVILRGELDHLHEAVGRGPLLDVADELVARAGDDDYFVSRRLFPNADLYSGLTYEAIGIPPAMFGVMFALARSAGWLAQWLEMVQDPEQTSVRPRQLYTGERDREYLPVGARG